MLDIGEASCLAAALQTGAALLPMDERLARREARRQGIALTGTAAALCAAKARGWVKPVVPILEEIRGAGYFPADAVL